VYFAILAGVNILNLLFFRYASIAAQSSAASLGMAITMVMSQHIILSLHDWRAVSACHSCSHELAHISPIGNHGNTIHPGGGGTGVSAGRLRNLSTNIGSSPSPHHGFSSPTTFTGIDFVASSITFDEEGGSNNHLSKHHHPPSRSLVREFVSSRKTMEEEDRDIPVEVRVQIEEELKNDYNSVQFVSVYRLFFPFFFSF